MAGCSRTGSDAWVVNIQNEVRGVYAEEEEVRRWKQHCIYRVPSYIKDLNPGAYVPRVVSFGPYCHGEDRLRSMEEHKDRSLLHLLRRCGKPLNSFMEAVGEVVQQLMDAYAQLDGEWRDDPERFLQLMVVDGCFMLEIMRAHATPANNGYASNDPIFGSASIRYTARYVRWDMRLIENQLPLLLLYKLMCVETSGTRDPLKINQMVGMFFLDGEEQVPPTTTLRLHPLDVWRGDRSERLDTEAAVCLQKCTNVDPRIAFKPLSATKLREAGIQLKVMSRPQDNWFVDGVLSLPTIWINLTTEIYFLNLMVFEQLHADAGDQITSLVFFASRLIKSDKDVALLRSHEIVLDALGNDQSTAAMIDRLSTNATPNPGDPLTDVLQRMREYCDRPWRRWRAKIVHTYFRIPGTGYSLAGALLVLSLTVTQVVYAVLQYHGD